MNHLQHTLSVIEFLKTQTDEVCLFYSGGKDSIVLCDLLSMHFKVNLALMYLVDGLEHVEKYIDWASKKYNVQCRKYPHWMLTGYMNDNFYRFHEKPVPVLKLKDIEEQARRDAGCKWIISGIKQTDSLNRKLILRTFFMQAIDLKGSRAYPLSSWTKNECLAYIRQHRLPMPIQYANTRSSGVDLNKEVLFYLQKHYPADLKKILQVFPFAGALIFDHDK